MDARAHDDPLPRLPGRDPRGHKGTFGTVSSIGGCCAGSTRMIGAPALSALGALRAGAGLVKLIMPRPILDSGIVLCPSATGIALDVESDGSVSASAGVGVVDQAAEASDCLVIGPGLGRGNGPRALSLRAVQQASAAVVVDADALNALAEVPDLFRDFHAAAILTPHPGEFARLAQAQRITASPVDPATRGSATEQLAQKLGCVVVLKGAGTVVSNGLRTWVCSRGHSALATAGTGDVLAGVIAGLAAQFFRPGRPSPGGLDLFDVARLGVQAHAVAGEAWAARSGAGGGLVAAELADLLPHAIESLRSI